MLQSPLQSRSHPFTTRCRNLDWCNAPTGQSTVWKELWLRGPTVDHTKPCQWKWVRNSIHTSQRKRCKCSSTSSSVYCPINLKNTTQVMLHFQSSHLVDKDGSLFFTHFLHASAWILNLYNSLPFNILCTALSCPPVRLFLQKCSALHSSSTNIDIGGHQLVTYCNILVTTVLLARVSSNRLNQNTSVSSGTFQLIKWAHNLMKYNRK